MPLFGAAVRRLTFILWSDINLTKQFDLSLKFRQDDRHRVQQINMNFLPPPPDHMLVIKEVITL